ncbi:MAG: glycosyltransferase family 39 protein [Xanthomonadales bacterium]|nr:glycosyltransferase family 39 protein [Xanthomonadales bacterium]
MQDLRRARTLFLGLWLALCLIRLILAATLPLFVDEAFYWQEGRHLSWAYSDLPGLTAWLVALGTQLAGDHLLGVRWPFLLLSAALPWLVVRAAWPLGALRAWQAGALTVVFPFTALLGVLALPDVPMNVAAVLCLIGGVCALQTPDRRAAAWLAAGLVVGGLSHYRFLGVMAVGALVLLCLPQGRRALRQPWILIAITLGLLAWLPLAWWNLEHAEAGWRFQLVDRHPWRPQWQGLLFPLIQMVLVTPLLFWAMLRAACRIQSSQTVATRWFALCGGLTLLGFFVLGIFADTARVSFHWPLPAYLALLPLLPEAMPAWSSAWRRAAYALVIVGLTATLAASAWVALPSGRAALAGSSHYPDNFAAWEELAEAVRHKLGLMPTGTQVIADHFKIGAELGFALHDADIAVLDHPLNQHHGRAAQLAIWGLLDAARIDESWRLLVVADSDLKLSQRLSHYQSLCQRLGALPAADTVEVDFGARRFLLFALPPGRQHGACVPPAIAHIDFPQDGDTLTGMVALRGWVVKELVGVKQVFVLLDGQRVAQVNYGQSNPQVSGFLNAASSDPNLPKVQFEARFELPATVSAGWHVLGLEIESGVGQRERWSGPRIKVGPSADR